VHKAFLPEHSSFMLSSFLFVNNDLNESVHGWFLDILVLMREMIAYQFHADLFILLSLLFIFSIFFKYSKRWGDVKGHSSLLLSSYA